MIELNFDRGRRLLLVTFSENFDRSKLEELDRILAIFIEREGSADAIINFCPPPGPIDTQQIIGSAQQRSRLPQNRRVFVAEDSFVFGMPRMYSVYKEGQGERPLELVRALDEAFALYGLSAAEFQGSAFQV